MRCSRLCWRTLDASTRFHYPAVLDCLACCIWSSILCNSYLDVHRDGGRNRTSSMNCRCSRCICRWSDQISRLQMLDVYQSFTLLVVAVCNSQTRLTRAWLSLSLELKHHDISSHNRDHWCTGYHDGLMQTNRCFEKWLINLQLQLRFLCNTLTLTWRLLFHKRNK